MEASVVTPTSFMAVYERSSSATSSTKAAESSASTSSSTTTCLQPPHETRQKLYHQRERRQRSTRFRAFLHPATPGAKIISGRRERQPICWEETRKAVVATTRRVMDPISPDGGLELRAGSSAGSSVKAVAAAYDPSTSSLSTQAMLHIGFETKVAFDAQHELAKSRSSRFHPLLSSARSPDARVQGKVAAQHTITGAIVVEPRPIDFRLQAFAPRPPKRNTRASMRPERFGGQHYHLARAQNDAHTRPRSRGATQSPNLDELELAHVPVVSSRIARGSPLRDGVNAVAGDFGASRNWSRPSNQISERRSDTSNSIYGSTSKSPLPTPNAHTKNVRTSRPGLEERPAFEAFVRIARPFTSKRIAAINERPGVKPYVNSRSHEFHEVPKATAFGMEEFKTRFEKDPFQIKFKSRTLDTVHSPVSENVSFRDVKDSLWTDPILRHREANEKLFLPRIQWPNRFEGTTRHRLQWRDPRQAFLEHVEEEVRPVWASQRYTGRELPVAELPIDSRSASPSQARAPILRDRQHLLRASEFC